MPTSPLRVHETNRGLASAFARISEASLSAAASTFPPPTVPLCRPFRGHEHLRRRVLGRAADGLDERHEDEGHALVLERHELLVEGHTRPSFILPSSLIIDWFQGGSQVIRTSASPTPGTRRILPLASSAIAGPIPQPGAVSVMATFTL
jgi:hypothetical protein